MAKVRDEWPLAAFTLLAQLALGAVGLAALLSLVGAGAVAASLSRRLLWVAAAALPVGLLLSLLHLGTPLGGYRALRNLRRSWLSREILLTSLFTGLTLLSAFWPGASGLPAGLAALAGVAAIHAMSRIYRGSIVPAWTTFFTPLSFFTAALTLGAAAGAVSLISLGPALPADGTTLLLLWLSELAGVGLLIQLGGHALYLRLLRRGNEAACEAYGLLTGPYAWALVARLGAGLGGLALLALAGGGGGAMVWLGAAALTGAELLGRLLFYAAGVPIRVG